MAITHKKVNVFTTKIIKNTQKTIIGTTLNVILSLSDIKQCIIQMADVYEILGKYKVVKLDLKNYDKDNSGGTGGDVGEPEDYIIDEINIVDDLPVDTYENVLYVLRSTKEGWIFDKSDQKWVLIFNHVSDEIKDDVTDYNPVSGESVKAYLIKKLNEMTGINVFGKTDKTGEGHDDTLFVADEEGNLKSTNYKIGKDKLEDSEDKSVVTIEALIDALTWKTIS